MEQKQQEQQLSAWDVLGIGVASTGGGGSRTGAQFLASVEAHAQADAAAGQRDSEQSVAPPPPPPRVNEARDVVSALIKHGASPWVVSSPMLLNILTRKIAGFWGIEQRLTHLPRANPVSLTRRNGRLAMLRKHQYVVHEKSNGTRVHLLLTTLPDHIPAPLANQRVAVVIDAVLKMQEITVVASDATFQDSYFDGELVWNAHKRRREFLAFDVMRFAGKSTCELDYLERLSILQRCFMDRATHDRFELKLEVQAERRRMPPPGAVGPPPPLATLPTNLARTTNKILVLPDADDEEMLITKSVLPCFGDDIRETETGHFALIVKPFVTFNELHAKFDELTAGLEHSSEGLVFTRIDQPVLRGINPWMFKWKDAPTVDLLWNLRDPTVFACADKTQPSKMLALQATPLVRGCTWDTTKLTDALRAHVQTGADKGPTLVVEAYLGVQILDHDAFEREQAGEGDTKDVEEDEEGDDDEDKADNGTMRDEGGGAREVVVSGSATAPTLHVTCDFHSVRSDKFRPNPWQIVQDVVVEVAENIKAEELVLLSKFCTLDYTERAYFGASVLAQAAGGGGGRSRVFSLGPSYPMDGETFAREMRQKVDGTTPSGQRWGFGSRRGGGRGRGGGGGGGGARGGMRRAKGGEGFWQSTRGGGGGGAGGRTANDGLAAIATNVPRWFHSTLRLASPEQQQQAK